MLQKSNNRPMKRISAITGALALFLPSAAWCQEWHTGLCYPKVDASVSFPIGGVIAQILKKENDTVHEGDVIIELESTIESLEVARQALAVEAAKKDFDRTKKVRADGGSVSQEEVEQKEAIWKVAQVEKQQAEAQLKRRQLTAPSDGVLTSLFDLDKGEAVAPNTPAARVVDITECRFKAHVKGDTAHGFEKGREVEIEFNTDKGKVTVQGAVEFVSQAIDPASGLQEVRAVFDNKDKRVSSGLLGKMKLKTAK
jgi:RND family efflux transporter MFP subunit